MRGSRLTLGSILVFFRLRHFAAHRSQFGCVIPDLDKNRNPFNCRPSSGKSLPKVPGAEIRALWTETRDRKKKRGSPFPLAKCSRAIRTGTNGPWELIEGGREEGRARCLSIGYQWTHPAVAPCEHSGAAHDKTSHSVCKHQAAPLLLLLLRFALHAAGGNPPYLLHVFCYINAHG